MKGTMRKCNNLHNDCGKTLSISDYFECKWIKFSNQKKVIEYIKKITICSFQQTYFTPKDTHQHLTGHGLKRIKDVSVKWRPYYNR
jgi:hypothetical protein